MRIRTVCPTLLLTFLPLGICTSPAQTITPCTPGAMGGMPILGFQPNGPALTVTEQETSEQKLADGNAIHRTSETTHARDANGRVMEQRIVGCQMDADGQWVARVRIEIFDPRGHTHTSWETGPNTSPVVNVFHASETPPPPPPVPPTPAPMRLNGIQAKHEQLGTKNIAGIAAVGTRTTLTVAAGAEGNDLPLVSVNERWYSRDYGITLMESNEDPRSGKTTRIVTNLQIGDPDPALFTPPASYQVRDEYPAKIVERTATATAP
jgi:hypothetical protein